MSQRASGRLSPCGIGTASQGEQDEKRPIEEDFSEAMQYLVDERHLVLPSQITGREVRGWLAFLRSTPSAKDTARSASTVAAYARSAHAFCHWLVCHGHLERTPFVKGTRHKARHKAIYLIEPDEFERLLLACWAPRAENDVSGERTTARNRAILWVFLDTGMLTSQLCGLRLGDVDREHRTLRVHNTRGQERWLALSPNGWYQLLSYLEHHRSKKGSAEEPAEQEPLFLSETYQSLTKNAITQVFDRLSKRAGITDKPVRPSVLRDTFTVRYLQVGGELEALRDLLGLADVAALKRYVRLSERKSQHGPTQAPEEEHPPRPQSVRQTRRRRRRKTASAASRTHQRREGGRPDGSLRKEHVSGAGDDP